MKNTVSRRNGFLIFVLVLLLVFTKPDGVLSEFRSLDSEREPAQPPEDYDLSIKGFQTNGTLTEVLEMTPSSGFQTNGTLTEVLEMTPSSGSRTQLAAVADTTHDPGSSHAPSWVINISDGRTSLPYRTPNSCSSQASSSGTSDTVINIRGNDYSQDEEKQARSILENNDLYNGDPLVHKLLSDLLCNIDRFLIDCRQQLESLLEFEYLSRSSDSMDVQKLVGFLSAINVKMEPLQSNNIDLLMQLKSKLAQLVLYLQMSRKFRGIGFWIICLIIIGGGMTLTEINALSKLPREAFGLMVIVAIVIGLLDPVRNIWSGCVSTWEKRMHVFREVLADCERFISEVKQVANIRMSIYEKVSRMIGQNREVIPAVETLADETAGLTDRIRNIEDMRTRLVNFILDHPN